MIGFRERDRLFFGGYYEGGYVGIVRRVLGVFFKFRCDIGF